MDLAVIHYQYEEVLCRKGQQLSTCSLYSEAALVVATLPRRGRFQHLLAHLDLLEKK
jgi:hypothetical protein